MKNTRNYNGLKTSTENLKTDLDFLFSFVNAKEESPEQKLFEKGIRNIIANCSALLKNDKKIISKYDFSTLTTYLQSHLKIRLNTLILPENSMHYLEVSVWKNSGALEWRVDPFTKNIKAQIILEISEDEEEIEVLMSVLDLRLIEVIQGLGLRVDRFRKCPKCGVYFYQKTGKTKIFCSVRCGNAVRVQKFREKRREK